ncbi:hypothetical protein Ahy_B03g067635 [Arachis hypogaea]|uniref:Uncharacterized protein n=1 Tax=Arachis hypogaea TaxID=3818 RepID=A0A445A7M7_ARAHY|nr:hypothetical protein Ahy_B03g067635 [Arachis hypogaea]
MNYTLITDNLIVGFQPQKPEDINHLKKEEDLKSIKRRCDELDVRHMRRPAIDFDPNFLRNILPKAV